MILTIILYLLAAIGIPALLFLIWKLPRRQANKYNIEPYKRWQVENEFRKTLLQVVGGFVVIIGLYIAFQEIRNFHISQENMKAGQIASRFSQAIKFLGEDNTTQNIGGIYSLEQIAKESPENYLGTVIEVVSSFVRNAKTIPYENFETWKRNFAPKDKNVKEWYKKYSSDQELKHWLEKNGNESYELKNLYNRWEKDYYEIKPETQIAMTVLGRIRTDENKDIWEKFPRINLIRVKLGKAYLKYANLTKGFLKEADLKKVDFREATLTEAILWEANLTEAKLTVANLRKVILLRAKLTGADLSQADLTEAYLPYANLAKAKLNGTDLSDAHLTRAVLIGADLTGADLTGATLWEVNLTGADLMGADLTGADLKGADLTDAKHLTKEQLLEVRTLYDVIGLDPEMEQELRDEKSNLFKDPKKEDEKKNKLKILKNCHMEKREVKE